MFAITLLNVLEIAKVNYFEKADDKTPVKPTGWPAGWDDFNKCKTFAGCLALWDDLNK